MIVSLIIGGILLIALLVIFSEVILDTIAEYIGAIVLGLKCVGFWLIALAFGLTLPQTLLLGVGYVLISLEFD